MKIIKKENLEESKWSGGRTTELFIAPETANYKEREFQMRVSTATVTLKESTFTPLPGVKRHLMILEGDMKLIHKGQYDKHLEVYEQDFFPGDYETSSISKSTVVDFNLMLKGAFTGRVAHRSIKNEGVLTLTLTEHTPLHKGVYCHKGEVSIMLNGSDKLLRQGDYLIIDTSELSDHLTLIGDAELIEVDVWSE